MANFSQSPIDKGSDIFKDFLCSTCEDKTLDQTADFYCKPCMKFYCGKCIYIHSQLFTIHSPFGRGDMKKWPVAKKGEDFLLKCDVHKEENLKMLCEDHSELCCTNCVILTHRHCKKVTLDKVKNQSIDLQKLADSIRTILQEIKTLQGSLEASIQYVQISYDGQLNTIQETRRKINAALDTIEHMTRTEMKDTLTKLQASSKSDFNTCIGFRDELQQLGDSIKDIYDKNKLELSFIAVKKCEAKIQQSETFLIKNSHQVNVSITFEPNCEIEQYLSKLSGLGRIEHITQTLMVQENSKKVFALQRKSEQNVAISSDSSECNITAIIVLPDSQVLVADNANNITACTALYKYTLSGKLVSKMYEDTSGSFYSMELCCESNRGQVVYHKQLPAQAPHPGQRWFNPDPALLAPDGVLVTPAGQVLVCGCMSSTILQLDSYGKRKLATLVSHIDGVWGPLSVCYNRQTASIIVGLHENSSILVFNVQ